MKGGLHREIQPGQVARHRRGGRLDAQVRIELFGEMRVSIGSQVHTRFRTYKAAYLLAYLALHPRQPQPRERLIELFWADKEGNAGRDGLSTALAQLRRQLETDGLPPDSILVADRHQVQINADTVGTDVADFERLLRQVSASQERSQQIDLLRQAADLYRGELLASCYEEWATRMQTHFQSLYLEGLRRLIRLLEEADQVAEALTWAQKATLADPYAEEIYRAQMRLLIRLRQPSVALQTYERLEQLFRRDLGALPSPATQQMADAIRQDPRALALLRAEAEAQSAGVTVTAPAPVLATPETVGRSPAAPTLPLQLTRFFGRRQEQEQLKALLLTPGMRLVTILGPGGAGKTRLAVEVGGQMAVAFANRVWFVPLADIPDPSLIASALVNSLHPPPDGRTDPLERVIHFLGDQPCLLILDNLEHLLRHGPPGKNDQPAHGDCTVVLRLLLARLPGLVCLVTSRHALRLAGEQEFPLPPLPLPATTAGSAVPELLANESVALYVDRACAVRLDFAVTEHNAPFLAALCRRLEGMPLALEMAAAWAKIMTPQKMLERLEQQLSLLVSRQRDLPARHQSLRATIEWSYDLLSPDLRTAFTSLSLFRGGWTLEAAAAVLGSEALSALLALQEQSLILVQEEAASETRYRMLEPLREFAEEKRLDGGEEETLRRAHADHFYQLAGTAKKQLGGPEVKIGLDRLDTELDNLRAALGWLQEHDCMLAFQISACLITFWHLRGHSMEGCRQMLSLLSRPEASAPTEQRAWGLEGTAYLLLGRGEFASAWTCADEAARIWRDRGNKRKCLEIVNLQAIIACDTGDMERACELWQGTLPLIRELDMKLAEIATLHNLGETLHDRGQWEQARPLLEEALHLERIKQDRERMSRTLNILGKTLLRLNRPEAREHLTESLQIRRMIDDHPGVIETLETFVDWLASQGFGERAARLGGAAQTLRQQVIGHRPPNEEAQFAASLDRVRTLLSPADFEAAWRYGETLTREQAIEAALEG
jgi:predicted ATPase/DNA-binding SARP family transcriptional activator